MPKNVKITDRMIDLQYDYAITPMGIYLSDGAYLSPQEYYAMDNQIFDWEYVGKKYKDHYGYDEDEERAKRKRAKTREKTMTKKVNSENINT